MSKARHQRTNLWLRRTNLWLHRTSVGATNR